VNGIIIILFQKRSKGSNFPIQHNNLTSISLHQTPNHKSGTGYSLINSNSNKKTQIIHRLLWMTSQIQDVTYLLEFEFRQKDTNKWITSLIIPSGKKIGGFVFLFSLCLVESTPHTH